MEYISFRVDKAVSRQIEKGMKEFHYNTKSDFLRDAIRIKLQQLEEDRKRKKAWDALYSAKGIFKGKGKAKTEEEWYKWRFENGEKRAKELAEKYGWKL